MKKLDERTKSPTLKVTQIEDYNWKLWAFVLKTKNQVMSVFKEFQVRAERESGQKLKAVLTDNGSEYRGRFEEYCRCQGSRIGKGQMYAITCQVIKNLLGWDVDDGCLHYKQVSLSATRWWCPSESMAKQRCLTGIWGFRLFGTCACGKGPKIKIGQQELAMYFLGVWWRPIRL